MANWRKLEPIVITEEINKIKINENFAEIYVLCTGLMNKSTSQSSVFLEINDQHINKGFDTDKNGTPNSRQQEAHYKYNGLFWEGATQVKCNGGSMYYSNGTAPLSPYLSNLSIGPGESISFVATNPVYNVMAGTIEIWVR